MAREPRLSSSRRSAATPVPRSCRSTKLSCRYGVHRRLVREALTSPAADALQADAFTAFGDRPLHASDRRSRLRRQRHPRLVPVRRLPYPRRMAVPPGVTGHTWRAPRHLDVRPGRPHPGPRFPRSPAGLRSPQPRPGLPPRDRAARTRLPLPRLPAPVARHRRPAALADPRGYRAPPRPSRRPRRPLILPPSPARWPAPARPPRPTPTPYEPGGPACDCSSNMGHTLLGQGLLMTRAGTAGSRTCPGAIGAIDQPTFLQGEQ